MIRRSECRYLLAEFRWRCPSSRLTETQSGSRQDNAAFVGCDVYHPLSVPLRCCCHAVDLLVYAFSESPTVDWFSLSSRPHQRSRIQQCSLTAMRVTRCHAQDSVAHSTDFAVPTIRERGVVAGRSCSLPPIVTVNGCSTAVASYDCDLLSIAIFLSKLTGLLLHCRGCDS